MSIIVNLSQDITGLTKEIIAVDGIVDYLACPVSCSIHYTGVETSISEEP